MLSKKNRLNKRGSFSYVYRKGQAKTSGPLRLTYVTGRGLPRVGISVPNTVGKATVRNKVKRRLRAAVRGEIKSLRGVQAVISARPGAERLTYAEIESALKGLFCGAGLYEKKENTLAGN